jgi:hypothetical protein
MNFVFNETIRLRLRVLLARLDRAARREHTELGVYSVFCTSAGSAPAPVFVRFSRRRGHGRL